MGNDSSRETVEKLLLSAKKEFSEKGYMKASLRSICKGAGVTTGALYFFFKDKDDLFNGVVGEPLQELRTCLEKHMSAELKELDSYTPGMKVDLEDDMAAAAEAVKILFKHKEEFEILITKAQGSSMEHVIDDIADVMNKHYTDMFWNMKGYKSGKEMTKEDKFIVHWMSHDQVDIFVHLLTHCRTEKEALKQLRGMFSYIIGGWFGVINNT
ncbi:MAG: TetR/AcrR family transcriptional regulator [Lachnospiraceae bacterium]|nr:TetR/AcrR family transcriptional regulator [Lachnospiraceae bacterium]